MIHYLIWMLYKKFWFDKATTFRYTHQSWSGKVNISLNVSNEIFSFFKENLLNNVVFSKTSPTSFSAACVYLKHTEWCIHSFILHLPLLPLSHWSVPTGTVAPLRKLVSGSHLVKVTLGHIPAQLSDTKTMLPFTPYIWNVETNLSQRLKSWTC